MQIPLRQAIEMLNISMSTGRRWIQNGKMQAVKEDGKFGPEYKVDEGEVQRLLAENQPGSPESFWASKLNDLEANLEELNICVFSGFRSVEAALKGVSKQDAQLLLEIEETKKSTVQLIGQLRVDLGAQFQYFNDELRKLERNQHEMANYQYQQAQYVHDILQQLQQISETSKTPLLKRLIGKDQ